MVRVDKYENLKRMQQVNQIENFGRLWRLSSRLQRRLEEILDGRDNGDDRKRKDDLMTLACSIRNAVDCIKDPDA